jgi:hypothetical protein
MSEVKKIDLAQGWFMANGKKYVISNSISVERYKEYEKLEPKLTYGVGFEELFRNVKKAYELVNQQKFADSAVVLHNIMSGIKEVEDSKRIHPALTMCALVINLEGEESSIYSSEMVNNKVEDWTAEGLDMIDFFILALKSIKGFRQTYLEFIQKESSQIVNQNAEN